MAAAVRGLCNIVVTALRLMWLDTLVVVMVRRFAYFVAGEATYTIT
jgi:hypothetical protein